MPTHRSFPPLPAPQRARRTQLLLVLLVAALALTAPWSPIRLAGAERLDRPNDVVAPGLSAAHRLPAGVVQGPTPPPQPAAPGAVKGCRWRTPVDGPVVDPFRPPEHRFGPGNLGLEYGVAEGEPVVAVADGLVRFRGPVAGRLYLVVEHEGGLRSTYGPVQSITVLRGSPVTAGQEVARTGHGFHLTARRGDRYVDPAPLIAGECGAPRLVPAGPAPLGSPVAQR